jgi:hypothetical protein
LEDYMPTEPPNCQDCRFFEVVEDTHGECRRHAPRVQFERNHNQPKAVWLKNAYAIWPFVAPDDWCGEYVAAAPKPA